MWRWILSALLLMAVIQPALGDDRYPVLPPAGPPAGPAFAEPGLGPPQPVSPYESAWPPPGGSTRDAHASGLGPTVTASPSVPACVVPSDRPAPVFAAPASSCAERPVESTWYFRQDAFSWNERSGGVDFVNEYGPLSTLGYLRRNGAERFRFEVFGGTMAYYGAAMYEDGSTEPYNESNGTDYLGLRGEYDLLFEPANWSRVRFVLGIGTRFWFRNLENAVTPSGNFVAGYQETWWTFYPYLGLETRDSPEPGAQFFASARIGLTPLTYQYATYFDTVAWPRCGLTGKIELGVRYQRFSLSAVAEAMTWGESAVVQDAYGDASFQPASRMLTIGGQIAYTF